jgi:ubiquinone/menaquinone biosynthesis C-methylase UbiE
MPKLQDPEYLRNEQYHNAQNLNARIRLHVGFSTNDYGWFRWVFDHFNLPTKARILELGCGPGDLWLRNMERISPQWEITLTDFSPGMLAKARENLANSAHPFLFDIIDAQSIPYKDLCFDVVIANHCIYHFPDRQKAISDIHRVLKPGGFFYTSTIGKNHLKEMSDLVYQFDPTIEETFKNEENPFTLEGGGTQLQKWFKNITIDRYPDSLHVTESEPLIDFVISTVRLGFDESRRTDFSAFIESQFASNDGVIRIQKDSGIFTAVKG